MRPDARRTVRGPGLWAVLVALLGLACTGALSWATSVAIGDSNQRLLQVDARQAAQTLDASVPSLQSQLTDALEVAADTHLPAAFARFTAHRLAPAGPFVNISLWQLDHGHARLLQRSGAPMLWARTRVQSFLEGVKRGMSLAVGRIIRGAPPRLGYGEVTPGQPTYAVYAETLLPRDRRLVVKRSSPFNDLNFQIYLGRARKPADLVASSVTGRLPGADAVAVSPFGDSYMTLVAAARRPLDGSFTASLPWVVLGGGAVISLLAAAGLMYIVRRRRQAEELAAENERLYLEQRNIAATLQHALLPDIASVPEAKVSARYLPGVAGIEVGGDWYDFVSTGGRHTFAVGDVSGRGLRAATTMASLRYATRAYLADGDGPGDVLRKLHRLLDYERDSQFATVLVGEIDTNSGTITLASAGHYPPLLVDANGARFMEVPVGPPVGVDPEARPQVVSTPAPAEGMLVAFTDGLVERRGESLDINLERLRRLVLTGATDPDQLVEQLTRAMLPADTQDDVVVMAVRWTAPAGGGDDDSGTLTADRSVASQAS